MTEKLNEVKKALEMCYKQGLTSECKACPYREHNNVCMDALMEDALAVINYLEEKQAISNNRQATNADHCVCCGAIIPEGQMVCPNCEQK